MKIAVFHELHEGGALRAAEAIYSELRKSHQVKMFQTKPSKTELMPHGLFSRVRHDFLDLIILAITHWKIAREIDKEKVDLVLVHPSRWTQAPFLLSFLRTRNVYYCQEPIRLIYDPFLNDYSQLPFLNRMYESLNRQWRKWIDATNIHAADLVVANSQFSKDWIHKSYGLTAKVVYLGVDSELFIPGKEKKKFDILFFGTPVFIEGYDLLLAAQRLSHQQWVIKTLKRDIEGHGVSDQQLVKIINQSRIVVCLARNEPFGLTVLEAASCGVPVIAINEGGYRESIVHGKTGLLIARDSKVLATAINLLLTNRIRRQKMGEQGRRRTILSWTWEGCCQRLLSQPLEKNKEINYGLNGFSLLVGSTALVSLTAVLLFRQIRALFPVPSPGPQSLMGFATYFGYPLWFEPTLFAVLLSVPILMSFAMRWISNRNETSN